MCYERIMLKTRINPRFGDTDALGHINNVAVANWFEDGRRPMFRFFTPDLDPKKWKLIIAKIEIEYKAQMDFGAEVDLELEIERVGTSSFTVLQRAVQNGVTGAVGRTVVIHYDYSEQRSRPIPEPVRAKLEEHFPPKP